jgi:uncharacterized protein
MNAVMLKKLSLLFCGIMIAAAAGAGEPDITLQNPAIEKLQARMATRAAKVDECKSKGARGEESTGLLKQMPVAGQGLAEKKEVRDLVVAENEDRYAMFRELILANGLKDADLTAVAEAYAKKRRQSAAPAHLIQSPKTKEFVLKKDFSE